MTPGIPEHYATLISANCRNELENMKRRTVSTASDVSQASSTSEFIDHKIVDVIAGLQYVGHLKHCLTEAFKDGHLTKSQYTEAMSDYLENNRPREQELVVLKRQKKIVEEDLLEEAPSYTKLEDAYASLLTNKVMSASAKQKKRKFDQSKFEAAVFDYYSASKTTETNQKLAYCHLTGWHPDGVVKAAHIVPESLKSEEVSYLFGVGQAVLSDPKNAITLESKVELGLDSGLIVLAPMPPKEGEETKWKCVLTDKRKKNDMVYQGVKWKDIDGKELIFLGASRPARRFLYFRFVITYLHCKNSNSLDWVSEVEANGKMWASPGPYLRRSMLVTLARRISDLYLPETFYSHTTFAEADGCASRPEDEEEDLVLSLTVRLRNEREAAQIIAQVDDNESESETESGDD